MEQLNMGKKEFINVSADELRTFFKQHHEREYTLIDVRQPREYQQGHIAGATLLPLGELSARLSELPTNKDVIFY